MGSMLTLPSVIRAHALLMCCYGTLWPQNELYMNGAVVLPHKEIKENVPTPAIIL